MTEALEPFRSDATVLVVIVAYNAGAYLQRCVDALERQTFTDWNAVVWDNASSDYAIDRLSVGSRVTLVRNSENLGFAAANNRAAALSRSRFIATLNPDAFAEPNWLEELVSTAENFGVQCVASVQISDTDQSVLDGVGDCMSIAGIAWRGGYLKPITTMPSHPVGVFSACAAAALYRRDTFEGLGGFEERFFCYYEDVDLGFRIRLMGGQCILAPTAIVRHIGSAASSNISGFSDYYGTRNRLWTFLRDMPALFLPIAVPAHILVIAYVLVRSPSPQTREARWRGLKDGWSGRRPWMKERRTTPCWTNPGPFTWSPLALSRRSAKTFTVKRKALR